MGDLREKSCVTEDVPQVKLDEFTTLAEDNNDSDDKKTHMIPFRYDCGDCSQSYRRSGLLFKHTHHSHPSVSSVILDSPRAEQRRAYNSPLHWDEFTQIQAVAQW